MKRKKETYELVEKKTHGFVKKKTHRLRNNNRAFATALAAPAAILSIIVIIYPLFQTFWMSFQDIKFMGAANSGELEFSLKNYAKLLQDSQFLSAMGKSLYITAIALTVSFILGYGIALLLNKPFKCRALARTLVLLAWPIPGVVVSMLFLWMFDSNLGIINYILKSMNIIDSYVKWTTSPGAATGMVIVATIWKSYPFFTLVLLAGLKAVPASLYESASIDGAGPIRKFRYITLPATRSVSVTALLLNGLWIFRNYDIVANMTGGGPNKATETLPLLLYNTGFKYFKFGYASTIGIAILVVCIFFVLVAMPALKKRFY